MLCLKTLMILHAVFPMLPAGATVSQLNKWAPQLRNKMPAAISCPSNVTPIIVTEQHSNDDPGAEGIDLLGSRSVRFFDRSE